MAALELAQPQHELTNLQLKGQLVQEKLKSKQVDGQILCLRVTMNFEL